MDVSPGNVRLLQVNVPVTAIGRLSGSNVFRVPPIGICLIINSQFRDL